MSRRTNALLALLLGAGLAALGIYVASRLEQVEEDVPIGLQGAARENSLLAAERFLNLMGVRARGLERLDRMPPRRDVLVMAEATRTLTSREVRSLAAWVAGGGRLIVAATRDGEDSLLSALGVEVVLSPRGEEEAEAGSSLVSIPLSDPEETLQVTMRDDARVRDHRPLESTGTGPGRPAVILSFPVESGSVTALSDLEFLKTEAMGDHDHARMLWRLVSRGGVPEGAWLVRGGASLSLPALVWRAAPRLIVALSLLILAWVWTKTGRFGPILPVPAPGSRSLLQHVEAVGTFLWRRGEQEILIAGARSELQREISRRRPYLGRLGHAERSAALASASGVPRKDILSALAAPCPRDPERFTRTMRTIESLRRHL